MDSTENICVLGLGHVGLTLSLVMAEKGFKVFGFDTNKKVIEDTKACHCDFYEKDISAYLNRYSNKQLFATSDLSEVEASVYIITVGTPINLETNIPRINYIEQASRSIGSKIKKGDTVILRSTVPVGTTRNVVAPILSEVSGLTCGEEYSLAYAPERTIEGEALAEIKELPQVIGGFDQKSREIAEKIFKKITGGLINDVGQLENAEMVKIMNNTFRDVKFAYSNELALICKDLGLDMVKLVKAANLGYTRDKIPVPSPGVGGACLSKDSYILAYSTKDSGHQASLVLQAREVNESVPTDISNTIKQDLASAGKDISKAKIFIVGFAFKGSPETSDIRQSTTLDLLDNLIELGASHSNISGFDPVVSRDAIEDLSIGYLSYEEGFDQADAVLFMNNHKSYSGLDIFHLLSLAKDDCIIFDGWHMFEPKDITSLKSIKYLGVGCSYQPDNNE